MNSVETPQKISLMKSRLSVYRVGLRNAQKSGNFRRAEQYGAAIVELNRAIRIMGKHRL